MTVRFPLICISIICVSLCLFGENAFASCASPGSGSDKTNDISNSVGEKITDLEDETKDRLQTASDNFVQAQTASATSATNNAQTLIKSIAGFEDASNQNKLTFLKSKESFVTTRELKPTIQDCRDITAKKYSGLEMELLTDAAIKRMDRDSRKDFTNDENSPYSKGVTAAVALQFIEYLQYYCNPKSNNGQMPSSAKPVEYAPISNVKLPDGTTLSAGTSHSFYCGQGRTAPRDSRGNAADDILIDADINVGDIMFGDKTWPNNDSSVSFGDKIYTASKQMNRHLNVSPRNPFNPTAFSGQSGIEAFMERRSFEARAAMAESQFNYISGKRLPTAKGGGTWLKTMLAKELAPGIETGTPAALDTYCSTHAAESVCGVWNNAKNIPETASKTQMMNYIMMDRFLGTDFAVDNSPSNPTASQRQQIHLLALDLIQQRETNEIIERILGTFAAKYALGVDRLASSSSVGSPK